MWCLTDPKIGEREVLAALLDNNHQLIREGQVLLADKGFSGTSSLASPSCSGLAEADRFVDSWWCVVLELDGDVVRSAGWSLGSRRFAWLSCLKCAR
jgi:hypothetical protein